MKAPCRHMDPDERERLISKVLEARGDGVSHGALIERFGRYIVELATHGHGRTPKSKRGKSRLPTNLPFGVP